MDGPGPDEMHDTSVESPIDTRRLAQVGQASEEQASVSTDAGWQQAASGSTRGVDERLYYGLIYGLGIALDRQTAEAGTVVRSTGRGIRQFLAAAGVAIPRAGTPEESIELVVEAFRGLGFRGHVVVDQQGPLLHLAWHSLLGREVYERLHRETSNPFLPCPLNAVLADVLDGFGLKLVLRDKRFHADGTVEVWEEIAPVLPGERDSATVAGDEPWPDRYERLRREGSAQAERLAALHEIGRAVAAGLDLAAILRLVAEQTHHLLPCDHLSLAILDEPGRRLRLHQFDGSDPLTEPREMDLPTENSGPGWVVRHSRTLASHEPSVDPRTSADAWLPADVHSLLLVPLVRRGQVIGSLNLGSIRQAAYADPELAIARQLADLLAIGVDNLRLREAERRRARELEVLNAIATAAASLADIPMLFASALERVLELTGLDAGAVVVAAPSGRRLSLTAEWGLPADLAEALRQDASRLQASILGAATGATAPSLLDLTTDTSDEAEVLRLAGFSTCLCLPLRVRGRSVGALDLLSRRRLESIDGELALLRPIADRMGVAVENVQLLEAARTALRVRDEFAALVSHELRTPIGTIKGYTQLARRWAATGAPLDSLSEALDVIEGQANRLSRLARDLLDATRIEAGRLQISTTVDDIRVVLSRCVERFKQAEGARDIRLSLPDSPVLASIDALRIEQVLDNFLSNAAKYSGDGSPIAVSLQVDSGEAVTSVADQGFGIAPEDLPHVFERFYRTGGNDSERRDRTGLGLYICKGIVDAHGGRIRVESAIGQGSTFYFTLACAPSCTN